MEVKAQYEKLQQITSEYFLTQVIEEPTRGNNILDLLYTNNLDVLLNVKIDQTNMSDHNIIYCSTTYMMKEADPVPVEEKQFLNLNFYDRKINWSRLK